MTWKEFVADIKQMVFPDREASNLVVNHTRYILDGLIEIQKRVPQLRSRNFNSIGFGDTFYQCRATIVDPKPNGPLIRLYTYTEPDHCDRIYYHPTTREHMENLMRSCGTSASPTGSLVGPEPQDYFNALGDVLSATALDDPGQPLIAAIIITPAALIGGSPATGTIKLVDPSPASGRVVSLTSAAPSVVQVPPILSIPPGAKAGSFSITTAEVATSVKVLISAVLEDGSVSLELPVHDPSVETNKGWRAPSGHYAVIGGQVYVWPHLESNEQLVIEWSGIKISYQDDDEVLFEKDVQTAVELYVQAQQALREDCDQQKFISLQTAWQNQASMLTWWYRTKELLPESPWREPECNVCATESTTTGGTVPPPPIPPSTFTVYLCNAGQEAPASYTEEQILAMENGEFGIRTTRATLNYDKYQIQQTASGLNEYRLICFPNMVAPGPVSFKSAGFPLPMEELGHVVIEGAECRVFRTGSRSVGPFTLERQTEITISA